MSEMQALAATPIARRHVYLLALGLALRLPGLAFNGQTDVFEMILDWGRDVRTVGLAQGFSINYGLFSFSAFGVAAWLGEFLPRFWWLPYKLLVILFDAAVMAALVRVCGHRAVPLLLAVYWLNPWFLWHGVYQGFWESPLICFALLAVLAVRDRRGEAGPWIAAGLLLFVSWQVKPQGLIHFAGPAGLLLAVAALQGRRVPLVSFVSTFLAASVAASAVMWIAGGSALALVRNLRTSLEVMPVISAGGLGFWRFVSFAYMQANGIAGEVHTLKLPPGLFTLAALVSLALSGSLLAAFAVRLRWRRSSADPVSWASFYLMITAGALVLSQFGIRAHINHSYGAMVLLVPLLPASRTLRVAWIAGVAVQGFAHLVRYGAGTTELLPEPWLVTAYGNAEAFATEVSRSPASRVPDVWLRMQGHLNDLLLNLVTPDTISVLGLLMTAATVAMLVALFELAPRWSGPTTWAGPSSR
jgi:hypothetical protein